MGGHSFRGAAVNAWFGARAAFHQSGSEVVTRHTKSAGVLSSSYQLFVGGDVLVVVNRSPDTHVHGPRRVDQSVVNSLVWGAGGKGGDGVDCVVRVGHSRVPNVTVYRRGASLGSAQNRKRMGLRCCWQYRQQQSSIIETNSGLHVQFHHGTMAEANHEVVVTAAFVRLPA